MSCFKLLLFLFYFLFCCIFLFSVYLLLGPRPKPKVRPIFNFSYRPYRQQASPSSLACSGPAKPFCTTNPTLHGLLPQGLPSCCLSSAVRPCTTQFFLPACGCDPVFLHAAWLFPSFSPTSLLHATRPAPLSTPMQTCFQPKRTLVQLHPYPADDSLPLYTHRQHLQTALSRHLALSSVPSSTAPGHSHSLQLHLSHVKPTACLPTMQE